MKHLRLILLLLAVCFTQISFSQDLAKKWDEEDKFKSAIEQVLTEVDTEQEAEKKSVVCWYMTASTSQNKTRQILPTNISRNARRNLPNGMQNLLLVRKCIPKTPYMQRTTTSWDLRRFATRTIPRLWNTSSCAHRFLSPRCTQ